MIDPKIPVGHHRLNPYFLVNDPEGFMSFLKEVFGATEKDVHRSDDGRMMHAEYRIGDSALMFGEASDEWSASTSMNYLYMSDTDATHKAALAAGCTELYAPNDEEYGVRGSGIKDRWGNTWWLAHPLKCVRLSSPQAVRPEKARSPSPTAQIACPLLPKAYSGRRPLLQ